MFWIKLFRPTKLPQVKLNSNSVRHLTTQKNRYTLDDSKLSQEQRDFYEKNGFIVIPKLVSEKELNMYRDRFVEIANRRVIVPGLTVQKDIAFLDQPYNENTVYKLLDLFLDEVLFSYCKFEPILEYVTSFTGQEMMAINTMLINKPPDSGKKTSRHPLHQDLYYFPIRPADRIVGTWTAMEKVDRQNGCLVVWPGSHKMGLLDHGYPKWSGVNKAFHGILEFDKTKERAYLEMEAGDCVFFHPMLVHGSGANRSNRYRKAISCHYASSKCEYIDVKGTNQQVIADELIELAKKKYGLEVKDVSEIWKVRSQPIRGERINL